MNTMLDMLSRGVEQLLGRASGPFHLRLFITPIVATIFAIRAGLKDARTAQPAFLWELFTNAAERRRLAQSGWQDIGKMIIVALVIDFLYQIVVLHAFYVMQALILVVVVAIVPYCLIRAISNRIVSAVARQTEVPENDPAAKMTSTGR